jgi:hypothetical protein
MGHPKLRWVTRNSDGSPETQMGHRARRSVSPSANHVSEGRKGRIRAVFHQLPKEMIHVRKLWLKPPNPTLPTLNASKH